MNRILTSIQISLPTNTFTSSKSFIDLFTHTNNSSDRINFPSFHISYVPVIELDFSSRENFPVITFRSDVTVLDQVNLTNQTGETWESAYHYTPIDIAEISNRLKENNIFFEYYDHLGINLPWIKGLHPDLQRLLKVLNESSLLHSFPNSNDWFFILPGNEKEIQSKKKIDYSIDRKPKFELVNFFTCSTPIIQIDLATNTTYEVLKTLFPESIVDDDLRNLWVYVQNESGSDICLVLNEKGDGWTKFFEGQRMD